MTGPQERAVLLVEPDEQRRILFGGWLEDAGFDVLTCPGPSAPEYSCVGGRTGACPLVDPASLIVLDLGFASDPTGRSTVGVDVMAYYLMTGKPIITLGKAEGLLANEPNQLTALRWTPERRDLIATTRALTSRSNQASPQGSEG